MSFSRAFSCLAAIPLLLSPLSVSATEPVKSHPRLLFRAEEIQNLRDRMIPTNDVWVAFKSDIVDKCLRDWKCSATSHYTGYPNYTWVRDSFTDESGVTHYPKLPDGTNDPTWGNYSDQTLRPAAPEDDDGNGSSYTRVNSEQYAMVFALMARLLKDLPGQATQRQEYLDAARECLFHVIDHAKDGHPAPDAEGHYPPFQHIGFAVDDRSFSAESFALAVDWIYEDLSAAELAKVRKTFLLWAQDCNEHIYFAPKYPHGPANSTSLLRLDDAEQQRSRAEIRLGLNNHWTNHMREAVLYALALDPKDDVPSAALGDLAPAGALTSHTVLPGAPNDWVPQQSGVLYDFLGVWQYLTDYGLRNDGAGGISMEGTQYASNGLGPVAIMLAALNSAGQDDPQRWGPQVSTLRHPFWSQTVPAYLAQLTPTSRIPTGPGLGYLGPIFQPPLSGDLETFLAINDQFIKVLAPMALIDARVNGPTGSVAQAVRYIQKHLAPGGTNALAGRISTTKSSIALRDAIYYFLLFDPAVTAPVDPRPTLQPKTLFAQHTVNGKLMGMVLGRSGSTATDTYFYWRNEWNRIDHQRGDSLGFGLWKNGLWLTKGMTGYGILQGCADYRNSLSLQNGTPTASPVGETTIAEHGSQWDYSPIGDPEITNRSTAGTYLYFTGDATKLYQHQQQTTLREIEHASRSIVWLKPNHVVIYDRAASKSDGYYKRFFLNVPRDPIISGNVARSSAMEGADEKGRLFVSSLLPANATIQWKTINDGQPAGGIDKITNRPSAEDMWAQIFVEAPNAPKEARFLHVVQGTDPGAASADATQLVTSANGEFEGSVVGTRCVMFRKTLGVGADGVSYTHAAGITQHFITGLAAFAGYNVTQTATSVAVVPGTQRYTDGGGVLTLGASELPNVEIVATDATGSESGDPLVFTLRRSGDVSAPLSVNLAIEGAATAADFINAPSSITYAAGSATAVLTLTPTDDADYEGTEDVAVRLVEGVGYHAAEAADRASGTVFDNDAPPGGTLQFTSTAFTALENGGNATITLARTGGTAGAVSVRVSTGGGTAVAGSDYTATSQMVDWAAGDAQTKTVSVPMIDNAIYTGDRTVTLSLSQVTGQAGLGNPSTATLTIADDDPPPPGNFTLSPLLVTTAETGPALTFTVSRLGGTGGTVGVQYATVNGSATGGADFEAKSGSLTWANGDGAAKTVTVALYDDTTFEGDETFTFSLSNPTGGATISGGANATITLVENDPQPSEFHVGPGQDYPSPTDVPWQLVGAGSEVFIHYAPAGYHAKLLLSNRGTAAQPIRVIGVPGPNGERPILDGANAVSTTSVTYAAYTFTEDQSLIAVERDNAKPSDFKPGYIEIHGLELRNAHPDYTYVRQAGGNDDYSTFTGAIYVSGADHVKIRDCVIHHCAQGVVTSAGGSNEAGLVRDLVIDGCRFYAMGKAGAYYGSNLNTQAVGLTVQFSRLEPLLSGTNVANVRDCSAGFVARCCWVEGGGSQLDLAEPSSSVPLLTGDPTFARADVVGCVLRNVDSGSGNIVHFGGTEVAGTRVLHFQHNTVFAQGGYSRSVLDLRAADESALVTNNVFRAVGITEFRILNGAGAASFGKNLVSPGYFTLPGTATGVGNLVTAASAGFVDESNADYRPQTGSGLIDTAVALAGGEIPPTAQFSAPFGGTARKASGAAMDLGAFEKAGTSTPAEVMESALGTTGGPTVFLDAGRLTLTIERPSTSRGLIFSAEASSDLQTWDVAPAGMTVLLDTPTLFRARDNATPGSTPKRFIRLRATKP